MTEFRIGDIVERVGLVSSGQKIKQHGRYVVAETRDGADISVAKGGVWWMASQFILIARGAGAELSQFINTGSQ